MRFSSLAFTFLFVSTSAFAATDYAGPAPVPDAAADIGSDILVTATRMPLKPTEVAASVTRLVKTDIDRAQDLSISNLLARTPGISTTRSGGYGTATGMFIRGADSDHIVVIIDGVKVNDPSLTGGGYGFAHLLANDISRIEVLRGTQSTLWGSQAIGGVINIVSTSPKEAFEGSVDIEAGSHDTISARAGIGGKNGPVSWRIAAQNFSTAGISAIAPEFGGLEPDGYRNQTVVGRVEVELADNLRLDFRGFHTSGNTDIDGFLGDSPEYSKDRQLVGYAGLQADFFDSRFRNRLSYSWTRIRRESLDPALERPLTFDSTGRNRRVEYQGTISASDEVLILVGAEHERSTFESVSPPPFLSMPVPDASTGKVRTNSLYGQLNLTPWKGLTLQGGMRYDHHNRYGGKTMFSAGLAWDLPTGTTLKASYGEGFKAPSLYQMFSEYGNAALSPETAKDWTAGVEQRFLDDAISLGATWFHRQSRDEVVFESCFDPALDPLCVVPGTSTPRFGYYRNLGRAKVHGIEATASLSIDRLTIDANYTWTVAKDNSTTGMTIGNWLPRRARHMANASVAYEWPIGLTTEVAVRRVGKSFDDSFNTQELKPYTLVDLRAEMALSDKVSLIARAENLFNERYMTAHRFNTLGRTIHAGIRGRF